ncbi:MAG: hypothetical protein H0T46_02500 [Deltaproteobacteria bacterium]|nr:hypothetical protein [Deltaproteobacteria bacterium]
MLVDPEGARAELGPVFVMIEEVVRALQPIQAHSDVPAAAVVAIVDLVNAFASMGTPLPQITDVIARSLLSDLKPERLTNGEKQRVGLAALAFGDLELARRFDTDEASALHAFLVEMSGKRDPVLYPKGFTVLPIINRALAQGIDAVTALWLGRLAHREVMGEPAGEVVREMRGDIDYAIRHEARVREAEAAEREALKEVAVAFPHGALVAGGAFLITDHLRGIGARQLWRAMRVQDGRQALVAIDGRLSRIPAESIRPVLAARKAANVELAFAGEADDPPPQHPHWLCVEIPTVGAWLPDLVSAGVDELQAIELALSAGRLLARALAEGTVLARVQPEYMWGVRHGRRVTVTAMSDRPDLLFQRKTYDMVTRPPFEREYAAPEVWSSNPTERSLVYSLAKMLVDWAGGAPASISALLEHALSEDPADRPGLDAFLAELEEISALEHKAFVFDYESFERELLPCLEDALATGDTSHLKSFINVNLDALRDPYEGEPLGANWASLIEIEDAHQYGDFALTKYYSPTADIGLGSAWERVPDLATSSSRTESPILGTTIGPPNNPFDAGKMGSYFQSAKRVRENYEALLELAKKAGSPELDTAVKMLEVAAKRNEGLYVTF